MSALVEKVKNDIELLKTSSGHLWSSYDNLQIRYDQDSTRLSVNGYDAYVTTSNRFGDKLVWQESDKVVRYVDMPGVNDLIHAYVELFRGQISSTEVNKAHFMIG